MSSPTTKKKRGLWSEESLVAAMAAVNSGKCTQRQAAAQYQIPRRTLRNHLKSGKSKKKMGRDPILSESQEKDLVERIIKFSKIGMPLTPLVIRSQAYKFCEKQGIETNFNKQTGRAGRDWLQMFLKRNSNVSKRKAQFMNPARAQKLNKPIVQQHFQEVKKLYDEINIPNHPERVYNMDEKGCRLTIHHQQKVLAEKGNRRVHMVAQEHAENVTIAACVNAAGNVIPPMVIFKGKRLKQEFTDNLPPGTLVKMAAKGSMTTSLFIDFIEHLGKYKSPDKCLLIFDGASCHLDYYIVDAAEKYNIILYCLPSNTTHELQPLDKSVNKSFENYWDQEVMKFMYHNPTKKINKARFNPIFTRVWAKSLTPENIMSGFRATGLFPFDPNAIPEDAYAPSLLTENQNFQLPNKAAYASTHASTSADPSNSGLNMLRALEHASDTDITDCEDFVAYSDMRNDVISPSLLNSTEKNLQKRINICSAPVMSEVCLQMRLVDYSSSPDSEVERNLEQKSNEYLEFHSPVPGPSGIYKPITPLLSDYSSSGSSPDIQDLLHHQNRQDINYDPYSDSNDENLNFIQKTQQTPNKYINRRASVIGTVPQMSATDDSDDDIPLNELIIKSSSTATFKELMPTPNFAVVKSNPRRKALNYKGQRIVKDLFEKRQENINTGERWKGKGGKCYTVKGKGKKKIPKKEYKKATKRENKKTKTQNKLEKRNINKKTNTDLSDLWFCHGCKLEREVDMRRCKKCLKWYHEECVGLTKDDDEAFFCPDCV